MSNCSRAGALCRRDTTSGSLRVSTSAGLAHARGVPYATAERFQLAASIHTPEVVREATSRGPVCPQDPSRLDWINGPIASELIQSEDCLVLSVTAPEHSKKTPVLVWFHGGAYVSGGGEAVKYDPDDLAREGIIVVNVTYRLGVFGYLTPEGAGAENLGLQDQILALRWVYENIAAFGGDPEQVTVFGQSAGGDSVIALIAAPATRGLFHRAIVQSAPLGLRQGRGAMTAAMRAKLDEELPGDPRSASTQAVLTAQREVSATAHTFGALGGLPFAPILGHDPLPHDLESALRQAAPQVDLLIGSTRDDAAPFVFMNPTVTKLANFGAAGKCLARAVVRRMTDTIFGEPGDRIAAIWRQVGGHAATFRFNWAPENSPLGACHCIELPFLFSGDWTDAPMLAGQPIPADLASGIRRTWADFARSGVDALTSRHLDIG